MVSVARRRHDWPTIFLEFVQGYPQEDGSTRWPTLKDISDKYGIKHSQVRRRASDKTDGSPKGLNWYEHRSRYVALMEQKRLEAAAAARARAATKFDEDCLSIANHGMLNLKARFLELQAGAVKGPGGKIISMPSAKPSELHLISNALLNFQKAGRLVLGEPTEVSDTRVGGGFSITQMTPEERKKRIDEMLNRQELLRQTGYVDTDS